MIAVRSRRIGLRHQKKGRRFRLNYSFRFWVHSLFLFFVWVESSVSEWVRSLKRIKWRKWSGKVWWETVWETRRSLKHLLFCYLSWVNQDSAKGELEKFLLETRLYEPEERTWTLGNGVRRQQIERSDQTTERNEKAIRFSFFLFARWKDRNTKTKTYRK